MSDIEIAAELQIKFREVLDRTGPGINYVAETLRILKEQGPLTAHSVYEKGKALFTNKQQAYDVLWDLYRRDWVAFDRKEHSFEFRLTQLGEQAHSLFSSSG